MRYSVALALMLSFGCYGQEGKKTTGPAPPTLNQPGEQHPMPIPREQPVVPPDVRAPKHETGRERPVAAKDQTGNTPSTAGRTTPKQTGRERAGDVSESKNGASDKSKQGSPSKASAKTQSNTDKR